MTFPHVLTELVIVFGAAAIVTAAFQALRLPLVLGYVLAGLVIGPHLPVPLVADVELVHVLSELGVILLMFTIGLELRLETLAKVGLPGALTALFEVGLVIAIGTLVARLLGFDATTAAIAGVCMGISSTMLVAKAFDELGWKGGFTEIVFAIVVFEDLIAIVLLAVVTAVAGGAGLEAGDLAMLLVRLVGFLALLLVGGLFVVPRTVRWIATRARPETLAITALFVCFGASAVASKAGYSVALGAFVAGVLIAESGHGHTVAGRLGVLRDVFAAIFFVSIGMSIDPAALWNEALPIVALSAVVLVGKPLGIVTGTFLAGHGVRTAVRSGLALAAIGELSFVIAGVMGGRSLLAIAVGVACVTTALSPLLVRNSDRIASWVAHRLPGRIGTFVSFYESWLARMRTRGTSWRRYRRTILVLTFDAIMLVAIAIVAASTHLAVWLAATVFVFDLARRVAYLARELAKDAVPEVGAAHRAMVLALEIAIALACIAPLVAIISPFAPGSFALLAIVTLGLVLVMRRRIADFEGHIHASSDLLLSLLAQPRNEPELGALLPGTTTLVVPEAAAGRTLAQLDLRARTGATVLAIARGDHGLASPSPAEPLRAGDVLALTGSDDAVAAASRLLLEPTQEM